MSRQRGRGRADEVRLAAYDVLATLRDQDAYTNLVMPPLLRSRGITGRDAAFATELVAGTLRRRGTYDAVLAACVDRSLSDVDPAVLDGLRLGAHQLLSMRVPAHAAVGSTGDVVRTRIGHRPVGFVNAVLRKVARDDLATWVARVAPDDVVGHAAVAHSHPRWVVEALAEAAQVDLSDAAAAASLEQLLEADNVAPKVTLAARPGLCDVDELVAAGGARTSLSPVGVTLPGGDPGEIPAVVEGRAGVQDEGSQVVTLALAGAPVEGTDSRWLDLCAGPGGKAALLGAVAGTRGARLLAAELQEHRARLVASATAAVRSAGDGLLGVVAADGTTPAWRPATFDRVLVDAPCTGLGALRRRPEARWRRVPDDVDRLVPLQRALLTSALDSVRPGGVVAYVTCSPVLAETAGVVSAVLAERVDVQLEAVAPLDGTDLDGTDLAATAPGPLPGTVQLWPHLHGTDAMFLALLRKTHR